MAFVIATSTFMAGVAASGVTLGVGAAGVTIGWGTILTAASVAYQVTQSSKMRSQARAAAEARRGFELVVQGSTVALPIVYGRALVGGARVWHKTSSEFNHQVGPANNTFLVGSSGALMDHGWKGTKNEFLYFQQALCQSPINRVVDVIVGGGTNLDEPTYSNGDANAMRAGMRIDCHYFGDELDSIAAANDPTRRTALFKGAAYASVAVCLNRKEPQFQGVPDLQFVIEGRPVGTFTSGVYSKTYNTTTKRWEGTTQYTTNPALCLLDYLVDSVSGKGLLPHQIDLESFDKAATVCATTVMSNAVVGGQIWKPVGVGSDGGRNINSRDIPLYECNIIIDSSKPVRGNVESILSTMGDARLVWSQGKYKLLVQYPTSNEDIELAGILTDDDLVMDDQIDIKWPSSSERFNNATVRFHNESIDFKEDSVSWPAKKAGITTRMLGSETYPLATGGWNDSVGGQFLNSHGVWQRSGSTAALVWKFETKVGGTYNLEFTADDSVSLTLSGNGNWNWTRNNWRDTTKTTFTGVENGLCTITANVTDTGGLKGFAGVITGPDGLQVWTSRSPAYTDRITVDTTGQAAVYNTMLTEDNNVLLETDIFGEGITDYYHALAKAEELVRTSRSAFVISFKYLIKDRYFEPGDIIRLDSPTLKFEDGVYIRVNEATLEDALTCRIVGARFDYTQLAWNVADDQYLKPKNPYEDNLAAPQTLIYSGGSYIYSESAGTLTWDAVQDSRVVGYVLYAAISTDDYTPTADNEFFEVGRSAGITFELPALVFKTAVFGVRSYTASGRQSKMTRSSTNGDTLVVGKKPPTPTLISAVTSTTRAEILLAYSYPDARGTIEIQLPIPIPGVGTTYVPVSIPDVYDDHAVVTVWRSSTNDRATAKNVGESSTLTFTDTNEVFGPMFYWVHCVSTKGVQSDPSNSLQVEFNHFEGNVTDSTPPPAPYNLTASEGYTTIVLEWTNPTHNVGGGHSYSKVYAAAWPNEVTQPPFAAATIVGQPSVSNFWFTGKSNTKYTFWVKEVSKGGGVSLSAAGPVTARTAIDVGATITALTGQINEGLLATTLKSRIDLIDASEIVPNSVSERVKTARDALQTQLNSQGSAIVATQEVNATQAIQINSLGTRVGNAESSIVTINSTNADQASQISSLTTRTGNAESSITTLNQTTSSQATQLFSLTTRTDAVESSVVTLNQTTANQASQINQVSITAGSASASAQAVTTVVSGPGGLTSSYVVKTDVNDYVTGFGFYNQGSQRSEFAVRADKFWVGDPSTGNIPFIVTGATTVNGVSAPAGVYIRDAFIQNGVIDRAKIGLLAVDTAQIENLAVDTLKIANQAVTIGSSETFITYGGGYPYSSYFTFTMEKDGILDLVVNGDLQATFSAGGGITSAFMCDWYCQVVRSYDDTGVLGAPYSATNSSANQAQGAGGQLAVRANMLISGPLLAGTYRVRVMHYARDWTGTTNDMQAFYRVLFLKRFK